jgi:molybdopterin molybdotransferase
VLWRLRQAFDKQTAVWPFEPADTPIVLAEIYASHAGPQVAALQATGMVRDEAQVRLMSAGLYQLGAADKLGPLFTPAADARTLTDEGWTLGNGHVGALQQAARG